MIFSELIKQPLTHAPVNRLIMRSWKKQSMQLLFLWMPVGVILALGRLLGY